MTDTKSKLHRVVTSDGSLYGYHFQCPGCETLHTVGTGWTFNGDMLSPTFQPSILLRKGVEPQDKRPHSICHSFIRDGQIQFLGDCTHSLAGKTVPLIDLPDWLQD